MAFTSRLLDPGASPSVPCAVKVKGGVEYQGVIPIMGDLATDDYDSGLQAVPTSDTQLTAARIYIGRLFLSNTTNEVREVTVQNAASTQKIVDAYPLPPKGEKTFDLLKMDILGLRWNADGAGVQGSVVGWQ